MATEKEIKDKISQLEEKLKKTGNKNVATILEKSIKKLKADLKSVGKDVEKDVEKDVKAVEKDIKKVTRKPRKKAPAKKNTNADIEKAKADLKKKTGKTEEECEKIIEQYKALRTQSNTRKKAEKKKTDDNKKRVKKLKDTGKTITGSGEKTAEAELESTTKKVKEKLDKEIKKVSDEVKKEVKEEVKKDNITPKKAKEKVTEKVKDKVKPIAKKVAVDTTAIVKAITTSLSKANKEDAKLFLLKLRNDIDKMLKKYQYGGSTPTDFIQTLDVAQGVKAQPNPIEYTPNSSPQDFADGGSIDDLDDIDEIKEKIADNLEKETDGEFDAYQLDWEDINSVDELEDACTESSMYYEMGEVIYYSRAMEYLSENDASLNESLGIASEQGLSVDSLNSEVLASLLKGEELRNDLIQAIRSNYVEDLFDRIQEIQEEEYYGDDEDEDDEFARGGKMKRQGYNDKLDESLAMRRGKRMSKMQNFKDRRDESKGMSKSMGRRAYASVGTMDRGDRMMMKKGGKSDFIQEVVNSPKFRKGAFTKKAKARGMSTEAFMKKVLANRSKYDERTVRQAQFMKNIQ